MNNLSEYEKIPSSLKSLVSDEKISSRLNKLDWVVTEKIHGANFRFIYQDNRLHFGKRKEFLKWEDDFFGFQIVVAKLESAVTQLFEQIKLDLNADKIIIYGELFGGIYPHPDVNSNATVEAIQTGVYYSPDIEFCAFDIAIENHFTSSKNYLSYEIAIAYFQKFNILHAKPLKIGKLSEVMDFDLRIDSRVPKQLKLPLIQDNLIEGVVIKPFGDISTDTLGFRPIIKIKNREFEEDKKYLEARNWSFSSSISSLSEDLNFLMDELRNYVNDNRLNSVLSKIGILRSENQTRLQEVIQEFLEDVLVDFNINNENILAELTPEQNHWIRQRVQSEIMQLLSSKKQAFNFSSPPPEFSKSPAQTLPYPPSPPASHAAKSKPHP
ncbi:2'-5' RNA ligase [Dyadobacter luticola]|uniref:2'-5' RNA ligase n=2 Tax=Dyadobacter luticola TaxID=1979387 RepID=A0A5R9KRK2_9BACT|nr:2'-5' RNA ligase [Dyadobacter luticola]